MARTRNIKPGFVRNETLAELPRDARLLFALLPMIADRLGRLEDRPRRIKVDLFPYDEDITGEVVDGWLQALAQREFLSRYVCDGVRVIQIVRFLKHQNPHPKEPDSVLPRNPELPEIWPKNAKPRKGAARPQPRRVKVRRDRAGSSGSSGSSDPSPTGEGSSAPVPGTEPTLWLLEFPCVGVQPVWRLTAAKVAEWEQLYPDIDVLAECRKALAWVRANHRKTASGMERFLVGWLSRETNRRRGTPPAPAPRSTSSPQWVPWECPHDEPKCTARFACHRRTTLEAARGGERAEGARS